MVVVFPNSISKSLHIQTLHIFIVLLVVFSIVVLLHLLLLLLCLHLSGLIVVHLVVHIITFRADHRVLLVKLIQQLHENLVVVIKAFSLDFLSPALIMRLNIVKDCVYEYPNVWIFIRKKLQNN